MRESKSTDFYTVVKFEEMQCTLEDLLQEQIRNGRYFTKDQVLEIALQLIDGLTFLKNQSKVLPPPEISACRQSIQRQDRKFGVAHLDWCTPYKFPP